MVKRYTFFAYMDDEVAELDCHEEDDGAYVLGSDFDAQAAELAEARALLQAIRNAPTKRCQAFFCEIDAFLSK